ncbi:MAG: NRDE family protein [Bacteroidetes bacterium]|nr:NRDE family protein [Bacteroidota bacterium]
MCLIVFAFQPGENYPLVVLANRDEFYQRPTARADWWEDHPQILAGRDLKAGGTWMGVSKTGRVAAITNFREPHNIRENAPSRGDLVTDYLLGTDAPLDYLNDLANRGELYNGFNLIVGSAQSLAYYSNRGGSPELLKPGIYGLSNHLLDTPWPKVEKAKAEFQFLIESNQYLNQTDPFFQLMQGSEEAPDVSLPSTGVPLEWEKLLSPLFIESPTYGTRVSTFLTIDQKDFLLYEERAYVPQGENRRFHFEIISPALSAQ